MNNIPKPIEESADLGKVVLVYSETGVGKTTSIFESAPLPLLYISTEPRNAKISLKASRRQYVNGDIDILEFTTWENMMNVVSNEEIMKKYTCAALDSLSYLMNVRLSNAIEDEIFESTDDKKKEIKTLINSSKLTQEGYGGLASQMSRLVKILGDLTKLGKDVIMTSLMVEHPKWDRLLSAAPALKGKEFPSNLPGSCDLIGYVQNRIEDNKRVFPPLVYFETSGGDEFLCKFTGVRPNVPQIVVPLDFERILGRKKGGVKKDAV